MSFRKEKKFMLTKSQIYEVKKNLNLLGMKELYPARKISSIYFDNKNFDIYKDSEEGVLPRKKIRVRWYNEKKEFKKEIKISSLEGRFKVNEKLDLIDNKKKIEKLIFFDQIYGPLSAKILINYNREYYIFKHLRITFDNDISYTNLRDINYANYNENFCVMELKSEFKTSDDYIEKIFNYTNSRFSKYCNGINNLNSLIY
jgi:SPX domain protein involved in polyphosphate accumulation